MKIVSKHEQQENQSTKSVVRRIFELHIELERLNNQPHDYTEEVGMIIDSLDTLFESLIGSGKMNH